MRYSENIPFSVLVNCLACLPVLQLEMSVVSHSPPPAQPPSSHFSKGRTCSLLSLSRLGKMFPDRHRVSVVVVVVVVCQRKTITVLLKACPLRLRICRLPRPLQFSYNECLWFAVFALTENSGCWVSGNWLELETASTEGHGWQNWAAS